MPSPAGPHRRLTENSNAQKRTTHRTKVKNARHNGDNDVRRTPERDIANPHDAAKMMPPDTVAVSITVTVTVTVQTKEGQTRDIVVAGSKIGCA